MPKVNKATYDRLLKKIFEVAGLDRIVTILDKKTGEPKQMRLCDIAHSHLARSTFIGNLYKKVKDPNLIGSMSGHVEGSRAFARYRVIDDEMKE